MALDQVIRDAARSIGFAKIGFAPPGPSLTNSIFHDWLARGYGDDLPYLRRQAARRSDVREHLPWVRTVVVGAVSYPVNPKPGSGFSTYAQARDYHEVLAEMLRSMMQVLEREGSRRHSVAVDATPQSEREWAVQGGIGWVGRQGQVVNEDIGCCFFLGEVLTDLDIPPSSPVDDKCGDCRKCIDACPTGAVRDHRLVDARRCLSCVTVERKAEVPPDLRIPMGGTLFGCDYCTAVCPWNEKVERPIHPDLQEAPTPDAGACLKMSEREFQERFLHSAAWRTGRERLQRNAAVALGNTGGAESVPVLEQAVASPSALVRTHAQWALTALRSRTSRG